MCLWAPCLFKAKDINFEENINFAKKRAEKVRKIFSDRDFFSEKYNKFKERGIFNQKRAWCSLRDFFKSPEFSDYFFSSLKNENFGHIDTLKSKNLLKELELPGDVWNNNPKFKKCILKDTNYENDISSMPKLIRKIYLNEDIITGYPEQFDITFSFVPRMCELNNCSFCPLNIINVKSKDFMKICVNDTQKYCTVALICCNYEISCKGKNFRLLKMYNENINDGD